MLICDLEHVKVTGICASGHFRVSIRAARFVFVDKRVREVNTDTGK